MPKKRKQKKVVRGKRKASCKDLVLFETPKVAEKECAGKYKSLRPGQIQVTASRENEIKVFKKPSRVKTNTFRPLTIELPRPPMMYDLGEDVNYEPEGNMLMITAPVSVVTEAATIQTPRYSEKELTNFGDVYEENILHMIHRHLELDPYHTVAYIGPHKESLVQEIEQHFCLQTTITVLCPGAITYKEIKENKRRLAFKISHVGAEEYFCQEYEKPPNQRRKFDRIIIIHSMQYIKDTELTLRHVCSCMEDNGKVMVVHRPFTITTLPYFKNALSVFSALEVPFMKIIHSLQRAGCEVVWELEHVPIYMEKLKWIAILRARYPMELEIMSDNEVEEGIRELLNGPLNYLTREIELEDRLLFITATRPNPPKSFTSVQRVSGGQQQLPFSGLCELEYSLKLTKPMEKLL